jgi:hypothetical protein
VSSALVPAEPIEGAVVSAPVDLPALAPLPVPADQDPYLVYLGSLPSAESRRTLAGALDRLARLLLGAALDDGTVTGRGLPWWDLRYAHRPAPVADHRAGLEPGLREQAPGRATPRAEGGVAARAHDRRGVPAGRRRAQGAWRARGRRAHARPLGDRRAPPGVPRRGDHQGHPGRRTACGGFRDRSPAGRTRRRRPGRLGCPRGAALLRQR